MSLSLSRHAGRARGGAVALCLTAALLAGCAEISTDGSGKSGASGESGSSPSRSAEAAREVPLTVVEGGGQRMVFVRVSILGEGPFTFALDTGASSSAVDDDVVRRLDLARTGERQLISGVTGTDTVPVVEVPRWSAGDVRLDPAEATVIDLGGLAGGRNIHGLLGSDVLGDFGWITVDYEDETLRFPPG
ncbi:clan AA aspartic protease [Streptomyces sp. HC44]|uniref:Clan AA aspartic protease n=1 Tax=Streptomyces scabichelini TaxID=2711217 RepID=A0A6G4V4I0_9ACTN|nr:retropepsin-like aspartic protease [Streptomyces scabichelini]NGO08881.1 clan AA aspartic protease [Streptomyces scabichelini]